MKPEHINHARDAIAAQKTYGPTSSHEDEAVTDYYRMSLDPNCGWEASLDEIDRLKRVADDARRHRDAERDEHDQLVRSLEQELEYRITQADRLQAKIDDMGTSI